MISVDWIQLKHIVYIKFLSLVLQSIVALTLKPELPSWDHVVGNPALILKKKIFVLYNKKCLLKLELLFEPANLKRSPGFDRNWNYYFSYSVTWPFLTLTIWLISSGVVRSEEHRLNRYQADRHEGRSGMTLLIYRWFHNVTNSIINHQLLTDGRDEVQR